MIIIPEIEKVLILVPRAGSSSLRDAVLKRYPESMMIYRHMEADGIPHGYDRWEKLGVIRHPTDRLWSLYKYLKNFSGNYCPEYIERMNGCVKNISFSDWIVNNNIVFTNPYNGGNQYYPKYTVNHSLPENRKSQFHYLRPDLGTEIFRFDRLKHLARHLDIDLGQTNQSTPQCHQDLTDEASNHMMKFFMWDFNNFNLGKE